MGWGAGDLKYRFQWTFPVVASRHDADVLFVTSQHVHRSRDAGTSWQTLGPDLTRAEASMLLPSGGPLHKDNVSTEYYATIFAFAESPVRASVLWAGSDDGLIHVSQDHGESWINVTPPQLPEWTLISTIEPSAHDAGTAYVAATRYKLDDFAPYLFKTADYGQTWTTIVDGIPADDFTRVIREDPDRGGLLYAGTETGLYVSFDDGLHWQRFQSTLPVTPIHDLAVKRGDLVVATHGRSFWIVDDLTPLHEKVGDGPAHLFKPRPTIRFRSFHGFSLPRAEGKNARLIGPVHITYTSTADGEVLLDAGSNPPNGVLLTYYVRDETPVELRVLDADGAPIVTLPDQQGARVGVHRTVWDMRYPAPTEVEGASFWDESGAAGPLAPPGAYQVQLTVGDTVLKQSFDILADPRVSVEQADLVEQFRLAMAIRDRLSETHATANRIAELRRQIAAWRARPQVEPLIGRLDDADQQLASIDHELIERAPGLSYAHPIRLNAKLAALGVMVGAADAAPTRQAREVFAELSEHLARQLERLRNLQAVDLAALEASLRSSGIPIFGTG
jgi:hypothetical protein